MAVELTPSERAVDLVESLRSGKQWTTADVAARYGLTRRGALSLLHRVSRVAPITFDGWHWHYLRRSSAGVERGVPGRMIE